MWYEILSMIGSLLLIVAVLVLTWYGTRWYARRTGRTGSGQYIKIVDRAPMGTGGSVAIVEVAGKYYLLGIGDREVTLLCQLDDFEERPDEPYGAGQPLAKSFRQMLDKARGNKKDGENRP